MSPSSAPLTGLSLITLRDLRARPDLLIPPEPILPRLVYRGRVTLFSGREKGGKSTFAAAGVAALSSGMPFLGEPTTPCNTVWLSSDREAWYDLNERFERFGAEPDRVHLVFGWNDDIKAFHRLLEQTTPDIVVIDTLLPFAKSLVRESSRPDQWASVLLRLSEYAHRTGCGVLLNHHASRATGEYRDSTAIGGYVDLIVEMHGRGQDESAQGSTRSCRVLGRLAGLPDFKVRYHADRFVLEGASFSHRDRVFFFVKDHYEQTGSTCSQSEVRNVIGGRHGDVDRALTDLVLSGALEDVGERGRHAYQPARPAAGRGPAVGATLPPTAAMSEDLAGRDGAGLGGMGRATVSSAAAPPNVNEGAEATRASERDTATNTCAKCGGELEPDEGSTWGLRCRACGFRP